MGWCSPRPRRGREATQLVAPRLVGVPRSDRPPERAERDECDSRAIRLLGAARAASAEPAAAPAAARSPARGGEAVSTYCKHGRSGLCVDCLFVEVAALRARAEAAEAKLANAVAARDTYARGSVSTPGGEPRLAAGSEGSVAPGSDEPWLALCCCTHVVLGEDRADRVIDGVRHKFNDFCLEEPAAPAASDTGRSARGGGEMSPYTLIGLAVLAIGTAIGLPLALLEAYRKSKP